MTELKLGERLKRLRKFKNLTLEEVSDKALITKGFLSQLERDLVVPSVTSLKQILDVYGESLSNFFQDSNVENKKTFLTRDRIVISENMNYKYEQLAPKVKYLEMEPEILTIKKEKMFKKSVDDTELFGFIIKGKILLKTNKDENITFSTGDCFYLFFGDLLHIENQSHNDVEILMVSY